MYVRARVCALRVLLFNCDNIFTSRQRSECLGTSSRPMYVLLVFSQFVSGLSYLPAGDAMRIIVHENKIRMALLSFKSTNRYDSAIVWREQRGPALLWSPSRRAVAWYILSAVFGVRQYNSFLRRNHAFSFCFSLRLSYVIFFVSILVQVSVAAQKIFRGKQGRLKARRELLRKCAAVEVSCLPQSTYLFRYA